MIKKSSKIKFLIGIDEAGRGALAGPVAVGFLAWPTVGEKLGKVFGDYPVGRDSKKLSAKQRDYWFLQIKKRAEKRGAFFGTSLISHKIIDDKGINFAIRQGIKKCLEKVPASGQEVAVLLDGGLHAPTEYSNQQTIIKGDEKELIISLASIVAKVLRDREMIKLSKKYPNHYLHQHKGYGTRLHYQKIVEFGALVIHRRTYLS